MSGKYDAGRDGFGDGNISWTRDTIKAQLVSEEGGFKFNPAHSTIADLSGLIGEPVDLAGKSLSRGWARANDLVFKEVRTGPRASGVVIWNEAGGAATLIVHHDQIDNFPMKPNGGDIHVDIPDQGLFRI